MTSGVATEATDRLEVAAAQSPARAHAWRPLSSAQRGIWFAHELGGHGPDGQTATYNTAEYAVLTGQVDDELLATAIRGVLDRTETLRLEFRDTDVGPQQRVGEQPRPADGWVIHRVDLRHADDPHHQALTWMRDQVGRRIDLARDPLVIEALLRVGDHETWWFQQVHHLCVDGYGASLLVARVAAAYTALRAGQPLPTLPPAPLAAVLDEDELYLASPAHDDDRAHWLNQLAGAVAPPSLTQRPDLIARGAAPSFRRTAVEVPDSLGEALKAASAGIRPAMWTDLLVAGTAAYVARMTGVPDVRLGLPMMNRMGSAAARVPCTTMNVVPACVRIDPTTTVAEALALAVTQSRQARAHSRFREEDLRHETRVGGQGAPFSHQLNLIPFYPAPVFDGVQASLHNVCAGPVDDLTICLRGTPGRGPATLEVDGNPRLYTSAELTAHAHRLLAFWQRLAVAASDPDTAAATLIDDLDLLSSGERELVVSRFNDTDHPIEPRTLADGVRAAAVRWPNAEALRVATSAGQLSSLTYAEFDQRVERTARALAARGVRRGSIVAVGLPRSTELLVTIHAIVRAGGAYLPIDVDDPAGRRRMVLEMADPRLLIAGESAANWELPQGLSVWDGRVGDDNGHQLDSPELDDPAYVLYTSGSTGSPKGVVITHRAIDNRLRWMQAEFEIGADDRVLQKTSIGFDVSVWELFWPLLVGSCLVVAPPGAHRDPQALADLVVAERITTMHFVPSMLTTFVEELSNRQERPAQLRRVICSGEALSTHLARTAAQLTGAGVFNLYGPTEAAVDVSCWQFDDASDEPWVPIGVPVWNTRLLVLDHRGRPQPVGAPGELHIGGVQVARGYLGRDDLTAERFIDDPTTAGERLYRTGDVAQVRPDGSLMYLGRMDRQVKIRGQRIEPAEVEAVLASDPGVATAVVRAQSTPDGAVLVAYLVAAPNPAADDLVRRLRATAEARLTSAMRPAAYAVLDNPRLTPSGKLDASALPDLDLQVADRGRQGQGTPSTPVEEVLCRLFAEVLDVAMIGPDDDFFDLGGHSLLAVRLAAQVRDALGESIGVAGVFNASTPAAMAALLRSGDAVDDLARVLPLRTSGTRPPLFCVHPAGGLGWCYAGLLPQLPVDQPVYAVQARGLHGEANLPSSLAEMAADYVDVVRSIAGAGPVRLLGWSVGGMLVHEMAALLDAAGQRPDLVVMMDAYPGPQWRELPPPTEQDALRAVLRLAAADNDDNTVLTRTEAVARLTASGSALARLGEPTLAAMLDIVTNCAALVRSAQHSRYSGDIVFIEAEGSREQPWLDPDGWRSLVGGTITRHPIAGRHQDLVSRAALAEIAGLLTPLL